MKQKEQELEYLRNTVCVYIFEHSFFLFLAGNLCFIFNNCFLGFWNIYINLFKFS